jgi:glycosyltransferase involved in cell wall biosynthesis
VTRPRRLLTVGHSYVVALNRRLAHELARAGAGRWDVTVAAPRFVHGDLRPISLEAFPVEACRLIPVSAYFTSRPHVMLYGRSLRRFFAERWDVIHCWEEPFVLAGGQFALWANNRALVYYTFQNIAKSYPPPFNWVERYSLNHAAGWLAAGYTVESALKDRSGYLGKPHRVIPLGVDDDVFQPDPNAGAAVRHELGWTEGGPPVIGYLGRFVWEKGVAVLRTALDAVRTPWRALFVGGGPLENQLRTWARSFSDDRVRVVTGVPHDAVPRYLNAMDVLAAPSRTTPRWKEQLGRMLIEAMACGVPVVGSNSGEIPHVIADAGLVLPEADTKAWTSTLGELLESPSQRKTLGSAGLARARAAFAWPVIARRHLDFFDELISSRRHQ